MFCPNCGAQLASNVNFCPACGAQVNAAVYAGSQTVTAAQGCSVMLVGLGSCTAAAAASLIQQLCGYSAEDALLIAGSAPIAVAQNLTELQANTLAQAMCEYGLEVSIYDGTGWREMVSQPTSVWSQAGALITSAASALGLIGVGNRIARSLMHRWDYPYRYTGTRPPVFRLHTSLAHRTPPPRPVAPHPAPHPAVVKPAARAHGKAQPHNNPQPHGGNPGGQPRGGNPGGHGAPGGHGGQGGPERKPR